MRSMGEGTAGHGTRGPLKGSVPHAKHGGRYRRPKAGGRGLGAIRAETGHQQLHLLGDPPVLRLEMLADPADQIARVMVHLPAPAAAEMELVVGMGRLPVRGSTTVETGLPDQPELREEGEGAINRRQVDVGVLGSDPGRDLVCREMSLGGGHDVPDRPSGSGHPVAFTLQGLAEGVVDDHGAKPILVANATRSQLRYAGTRRTECTHLTDF